LKYLRFASIDIGSNAVRFLSSYVFETEAGPYFRKGMLVRVPIRLGEDSFRYSRISDDKCDKLLEAMRAFKHLMAAQDIHSYKAYATSAMRDAENGNELAKHIKKQCGIKIEIISGEEEANVISGTDLPVFLDLKDTALFMDVGGGSTEFTLLKKGKFVRESFNIGTIRALFHTVNSSEWKRLKKWFKENDLLESKIPILGSGGNINKIFKVKRSSIDVFHITTDDLKDFYNSIKTISYQERIITYSLNPDRADVIQPACEIFLRSIEMLGSEKIYVPKTGLSDGIVRNLYSEYLKRGGK
jgi:exopolyphosphatase/guanosine-5'-triphosphate,3'-diphosphate pyrophosphatase